MKRFGFPQICFDAEGAGGGAGGAGGDKGGAGGGGDKGGAGGGGDKGGAGGGGDKGGAGGGAAEKWYAPFKLEQEHVDYIEGKGFDGIGTLLKSTKHFETLARDKNVMLKPDPKKPQEWDGFTELGWTPDRSKYQVAKPKVEQGDVFNEGEFGAYTDIAHKFKLAPWQAQGLYNEMNALNQKAMRDLDAKGAAENKKLEDTLRAEWKAPGEYDQKRELSRRAVQFLGADDFTVAELDAAISSPKVMKIFAKVGELLGEDTLKAANGAGKGGGTQDPAAARAERLKLQGDSEWMKIFNDPRHPQHKDYVAHRNRLLDVEARSEQAA